MATLLTLYGNAFPLLVGADSVNRDMPLAQLNTTLDVLISNQRRIVMKKVQHVFEVVQR
jgi:hypothetical protein